MSVETDEETQMIELRHFYHSFPRPRTDEPVEHLHARGLLQLRSIAELGLVLAPEVVEWTSPVFIGTKTPFHLLQNRICFTELAASELPGHAARFGPFSLEFSLTRLRQTGALPVIYMPQAVSAEHPTSLLGVLLVGHINHARHSTGLLHQLSQLSEPEGALALAKAQGENADCVQENYALRLRNNSDEGIERESEVPASQVRAVLNFLGYRNAPFAAMNGMLALAQSLFYPTDDQHQNEELGYYRQREWRITSGYAINGEPRGQPLSSTEKERLLTINEPFWSRELECDDQRFRRIDRAERLLDAKSTLLLVSRVLVPASAVHTAQEMFGDRVVEHPS